MATSASLRVRGTELRHLVAIAYAALAVVAWGLSVAGITTLPSTPYVVIDVGLDVFVTVGLWIGWRAAWVIGLAATCLGELLLVVHPLEHLVLLLIGALQFALLLLIGLQSKRPIVAS
jgi:hypothetical protein